VSKARETLERAIRLVQATARWGARVVYGDTDSLFVLVPGKSRQQAFKIGAEIAEAVTLDNPKPVKLKLEKVYQPCILQVRGSEDVELFENYELVAFVYWCQANAFGNINFS
jgi:DNA polymerase zeta